MPDHDIIVFVEEASAYEIVRAVVRTLGLYDRVSILSHQGAGDLERSYAIKIASDPFANTKFLILRDADNLDCRAMKRSLVNRIPNAKRDRSRVRLVCQELEAWYLAQPEALVAARVLQRPFAKNTLRHDVDLINDPKRLFRRHAHESGQIELARRIGPYLDTTSNRSLSFKYFVSGLLALAAM